MNVSSANSKYKNIIGKAKATIIFFQHPTLQMYKRKTSSGINCALTIHFRKNVYTMFKKKKILSSCCCHSLGNRFLLNEVINASSEQYTVVIVETYTETSSDTQTERLGAAVSQWPPDLRPAQDLERERDRDMDLE